MDDELTIAQKPCRGCIFHEEGTVFELCRHPQSQYTALGVVDFHTIGHMRRSRWGTCKPEGALRQEAA